MPQKMSSRLPATGIKRERGIGRSGTLQRRLLQTQIGGMYKDGLQPANSEERKTSEKEGKTIKK